MATFEAWAVPVTFVDGVGGRCAQWTLSDRPILKLRKDGKTLTEAQAFFDEAHDGLVASGRPFKLMVSVVAGRKPAGFKDLVRDWEPAPSALAA